MFFTLDTGNGKRGEETKEEAEKEEAQEEMEDAGFKGG